MLEGGVINPQRIHNIAYDGPDAKARELGFEQSSQTELTYYNDLYRINKNTSNQKTHAPSVKDMDAR